MLRVWIALTVFTLAACRENEPPSSPTPTPTPVYVVVTATPSLTPKATATPKPTATPWSVWTRTPQTVTASAKCAMGLGVARSDIQPLLEDWGYGFKSLSNGAIGTSGLTDVVLIDPASNLSQVNMVISANDDQWGNMLVLTALGDIFGVEWRYLQSLLDGLAEGKDKATRNVGGIEITAEVLSGSRVAFKFQSRLTC